MKEYLQRVQNSGNANQSPLGVYFLDNELASIYFATSSVNASGSVGKSNFGFYEGLYATRILTGLTAATTNDQIVAQSYGFVGRGRYFTMQSKLLLPYNVANAVFTISHKIVVAGRLWEFAIKFDGSNSTWYYKDSAGNFVALPTNFATPLTDNWYDFELVFDTVNKTYVQAQFGSDRVMLSDISGYNSAASTTSQHVHTITVKTLDNSASALLIDNTSFQYSQII